MVDHEHGERSNANHALDRRADKDIPQKMFAVRTHDDEIRLHRIRRPQDAVKGVAPDRNRTALNPAKLWYRCYLLGQDSLGFPLLHGDEVLRLVVVDDVNETKPCLARLGQQSCLPHGPIRAGGKVSRGENLHVITRIRKLR
jgi:hypothetical protein